MSDYLVSAVISIEEIRSRYRKPRDVSTPLHNMELLAIIEAFYIVTECKINATELEAHIRLMSPGLVEQYEERTGRSFTPNVAWQRVHKATYIHRQRFDNPEVKGVHAEISRYLHLLYKAIKQVENYATEKLTNE